MAQRTDTLNTVRLTIELMRRIPRGRKISAGELHEQLTAAGFVRDIRTVQRILNMLTEHFDVEVDRDSKPYGYRWKEQAKGLSIPTLNQHQSLLLALAKQQLQPLLPASVMNSLDGFFDQAHANLRHQSNARQELEWLEKVRVVSTTQPLLPPKIAPGVFEEVSTALFDNKWLDIVYTNSSGKTAPAKVMPLGLAQQGPRLYLVCRYDGFDNERSLALHRFKSARKSTLPFDRPKNFDLQRYDNDGRFGFGDGKRIRLTFRIEKGAGLHLLESSLSEDQVVKEIDDDYEISATVVESAVLERWLMGFGDEVSDVRRRGSIPQTG